MTPTNTNGVIAAAAEKKTSAKPQSPSNIMRGILDNAATKKLLQDSLKENAGAFSASIIDLFNSDKTLQTCDPRQVFAECLKAVSLKLPISKQLGFAYVIPYNRIPQFQIGYKGMIQLCMRTGAYKHINADIVYEGEFVSSDKLTGEIDLSGTKISDKIVGYFAYIETVNGFKKAIYWSKEKVMEHAKKFSKSYNSSNSVWKSNFDAMAIKTVLRNLLSKYGVMSVEMANALEAESSPAEVPENAGAEIEVEAAESADTTPEVPASEPPAQVSPPSDVPTDDDNAYPFD